jgi:hypothetical protein
VVEWKWHNSIDLNDKVSQLFFLLKWCSQTKKKKMYPYWNVLKNRA